MDRIAEAHDLAQKIRTMAKALEDAGHLLASRMGAPFVIYLRNFASRVSILNHLNLCLCVRHGSNGQRLAYQPCQVSRLDHQALVAHFASNSLPVKIFQQWNGIFPRQPCYLFKAGYVHRLPVKFFISERNRASASWCMKRLSHPSAPESFLEAVR